MWVDPELDPNDENNYDSINEECLTSEEIDEKAIDDLQKIREKENLEDNTQVFKFLIDKYGL